MNGGTGVVGVVGSALRKLLESAWDGASPGESVSVTAVPLDMLAGSRAGAAARGGAYLNVLLYRLTPGPYGAASVLPAHHSSAGRHVDRGLAVDLHYLLTAYGTTDFASEVVLTRAMSTLHDHPVLTRELLARTALAPGQAAASPAGVTDLDEGIVGDLPDTLSIAPESLDVMELAALWSAAGAPIRLSTGYVVSGLVVPSPSSGGQGPPLR